MMQNRWWLPEGIEEVLPEEAEHLEFLRRSVLEVFATWGYRLVIPPLVDFLDSLLVGTGRDLDLQTFKLIDPVSGRLMGLRADHTPQVARIDARTATKGLPARLCYVGTVLHTESNHLEKSRSPMQVGAELYGHAGTTSDSEIIRLTLEILAVSGVMDVHLDLGHVGIYRHLAQQAGLNAEDEAELFRILQRKDSTDLQHFFHAVGVSGRAAENISALLDLNGSLEVLTVAKMRLKEAGTFVLEALSEMETVAAYLERLFPALPIHCDLAELRGYHYQTGIVFAAFVPRYGGEIARGGRYDGIGKAFGHARPATGLSADLKVLLRLSSITDIPKRMTVLAPTIEDPDLQEKIQQMRTEGICVIHALPELSWGEEIPLVLCKKEGVWQVVDISQ